MPNPTCGSCGRMTITAGARHCDKCGAPLGKAAPENAGDLAATSRAVLELMGELSGTARQALMRDMRRRFAADWNASLTGRVW